MSYTIQSGSEINHNLTIQELKLKEAFYRGLRQDYRVTYPDGTKMKCEVVR